MDPTSPVRAGGNEGPGEAEPQLDLPHEQPVVCPTTVAEAEVETASTPGEPQRSSECCALPESAESAEGAGESAEAAGESAEAAGESAEAAGEGAEAAGESAEAAGSGQGEGALSGMESARAGRTEVLPVPAKRLPAPSISILDVELDPAGRFSPAPPPPVFGKGRTPVHTAMLGTAVGVLLFAALWGVATLAPRRPRPEMRLGTVSRAVDHGVDSVGAPSGGSEAGRAGSGAASESAHAGLGPSTREPNDASGAAARDAMLAPGAASADGPNRADAPGVAAGLWRVAQLGSDPEVRLVRGATERRTFIDALIAAGIPKPQVYRLLTAFQPIHRFDKTRRHDTFVAALTVDGRKVRAFEYEVEPTQIYQAREQADGTLRAEKLDMHVENRTSAGAVVVGDDFGSLVPGGGVRAESARLRRRGD